ncbi:endoribonuclease XendoU [Cooperia oncophora]
MKGNVHNFSLFVKVDESLFKKPSYRQFLALADNFNRETGNAEPRVSVTEEKRETSTFLTTVLESKPWKALYEFLHRKALSYSVIGLLNSGLCTIHVLVGKADTSGFEHVFMGEEKNREIFRVYINWLRFYYIGKEWPLKFRLQGFTVMASVKFTWKGDLKRSGSILIGTSPEYDMALYTLCFLSRRGRDQCEVEIDGCPLAITSFDIIQNNKVCSIF